MENPKHQGLQPFSPMLREIDEIEKLMKNKRIGNQSLQVKGAAMV